MKTRIFWLTVAIAAVALVASSLLFVDYVRPSPVFCAESGCGAMKLTALAHPFLGIPMPAFGIAGLLAIVLAACVPGKKARIAQAAIAVFGALVAAGLIGVQISMKEICPYCMTVDGLMLLLAVLSVVRAKKDLDPPERRQVGIAVVGVDALVGQRVAATLFSAETAATPDDRYVAEWTAMLASRIESSTQEA